MSWRFDRAQAGTGAIGDLGAHSIDLARYLVGEIASVSRARAHVRRRAARSTTRSSRRSSSSPARSARSRRRASRRGRINHNAFEINGSRGSLAFDLERMNELLVGDARGFRRVLEHGDWWPPGPHRRLGRHVHLRDLHLLGAIAGRAASRPTGRRSRTAIGAPRSCDAIVRSAAGAREEVIVPMKTSLGIWAFGPMVDPLRARRLPAAVGWRADRPTRSRRAVEGLGDLIDDYEFHYPQELSARQPRRGTDALDGHGIYCIASGLHLDPLFGKGGLTSPDDEVRERSARAHAATAIDFAGELGAHFIIWPGIEGYNYPFQTPYAESWARFLDGIGQAAQHAKERGVTIFLEHKNSEPAMKIFMRNVGMTLHVIHTLRGAGDRQRPGQHGLAAPDHERREPRRVRRAARGRRAARPPARELGLGHVRRRQHGRRDGVHGDARAGRRAAPRRLRRQRRAARVRPVPVHRGRRRGGASRSVLQWRFIDGVAAKIDEAPLREAQAAKDAVRAYELVYAALGA